MQEPAADLAVLSYIVLSARLVAVRDTPPLAARRSSAVSSNNPAWTLG